MATAEKLHHARARFIRFGVKAVGLNRPVIEFRAGAVDFAGPGDRNIFRVAGADQVLAAVFRLAHAKARIVEVIVILRPGRTDQAGSRAQMQFDIAFEPERPARINPRFQHHAPAPGGICRVDRPLHGKSEIFFYHKVHKKLSIAFYFTIKNHCFRNSSRGKFASASAAAFFGSCASSILSAV
ncbi:hypothetical protein SDC9_185327 [bioreactor metagenome]|uniref:Uncharacterized protein n=1 Tax=bioreactor metagenome TaxID=1076179 RepID=A0A645HGV2_9ZZZZ